MHNNTERQYLCALQMIEMNSFETSVKLLYQRLMISVIGVCIVLSLYYLFYGKIDQMLPNVLLLFVGATSYALAKTGREKIAYHFTLLAVIFLNIAFFFTVRSQFYSIIMMGCSLTIYSLVFFTEQRVQFIYVVIIILLELLLFHQAMAEDGLNLSDNFWPEYIAGVFHVSVVYLFGYYFMQRLRQSNLEIDRRTTEIVQQDHDLKEQEESLQRYIESNTSLENFTSLASHELKSPMRIIKSFVDLISKRRKDLSEEQIEDYLNMISTNSEKMSNLVDALHDLGSVSQRDLKKEHIQIKPFIESIKADETLAYIDADVSVDYDIDRVFGDPDLLRRLFSNLLSNALKFSSSDSTARVYIHCFERRGYFCFRISDNGIGIAQEKRTEVFELFNRQTNYSDYKGLGIGLALSKKIVDMHAGTIHILDSDLGGVCFEVRLPLE